MNSIWRGERYESSGLLLLGESAYSWIEHGEVTHPSARHAIDMVEEAIEKFPAIPFTTKLTRALALEDHPDRTQREAAWAKVAFVNYIAGTVGFGARVRPPRELWLAAKSNFQLILADLRPWNIIVLGKSLWNEMPETGIYITDDVQAYTLDGGGISMCWALQHPSAGLGWKRLANVISFACEQKIAFADIAHDD